MSSIQKSASRAGFAVGQVFVSFSVQNENQLKQYENALDEFRADAEFLFEHAGAMLTQG